MSYSHRYTEVYKGVRIDIKTNNERKIPALVAIRKAEIDSRETKSDVTLEQYGYYYLETFKRRSVSIKWYNDLNSIFERHILSVLGDVPMCEITAPEVQNMLSAGSYSKDFTSKIFNLTRQILTQAHRDGIMPKDISVDLKKPKGEKTKAGRSLTDDEKRAFFKVIRGHRGEMLCRVMYYCGLRTGEALNLRWEDVDLKRKIIHVRGTKTDAADRLVPIPNKFMRYLNKEKKKHGYVCIHDPQQAHRAWNNIKRLMNIELGARVYRNELIPPLPVQEPLRLYDLRHTFCTNLEKQGVPINIAARLMGHKDIALTSAIYTHATDAAFEMARRLINK